VHARVYSDAFVEEAFDEFLMYHSTRLVVLSGVDDPDAERPAWLPEYIISQPSDYYAALLANWDDMSLVDFLGFGKGTASGPRYVTHIAPILMSYLSTQLLMLHQRRACVKMNYLQRPKSCEESLQLRNRICGAWA
jgi:hypothetical protein